MRKFFYFIICIFFVIFILDERLLGDNLYTLFTRYYKENNYSIITNIKALKTSKYFYNDYSSIVHNTNNFYPRNKQELLDVYYTVLNNGWENFSYYCDKSYKNCLEDVNQLSDEAKEFSNINQLIHPFNSYEVVKTSYSSDGRIDINVEKKYTDDQIEKINKKINSIINELNINEYKNINDKIKVFHDYIINTNKYDVNKEKGDSKYQSDSAIGTLFEGYSICSGYTDTMAIFLSKLNLDNVRMANDKHTWNVVKIDNQWKHLDLTWDDPITDTGEDVILHNYFLISTMELSSKNEDEHTFDPDVYTFLD